MIITVSYHSRKTAIDPEPATVRLGEPVEWLFISLENNEETIRWTVYFNDGSPFPGFYTSFSVETNLSDKVPGPIAGVAHSGRLPALVTVAEGNYKYGVRTENPAKQEQLSDDDPYLIVEKS